MSAEASKKVQSDDPSLSQSASKLLYLSDNLTEWTSPLETDRILHSTSPDISSRLMRGILTLGTLRTTDSDVTVMDSKKADKRDAFEDELQSSDRQDKLKVNIAGTTGSLLWQSAKALIAYLGKPPKAIHSYCQIRGTGFACQAVSFTPFDYPNSQLLCVLSLSRLEFFETSDNSDTTSEEIGELSEDIDDKYALSPEATDDKHLVSKPSFTRCWSLSHIDPMPHWRCLAVSKTSEDLPMPVIAIGYSNGSIELINSGIQEQTETDDAALYPDASLRRSRIHLPCSTELIAKNLVNFDASSLLPLASLDFIDQDHLLVVHISGFLHIWKLDWSSKRFPIRLLVNRLIGQTQHPVLAAAYDSESKFFVYSTLVNWPFDTRLHTKISSEAFSRHGLYLYCISVDPPHLKPSAPIHSTAGDLVDYSADDRWLFSKVMSNLLFLSGRLVSSLLSSQSSMRAADPHTDAIVMLRLTRPFSDGSSGTSLLAGGLHCSGAVSVWRLPSCEPLLLLAAPLSKLTADWPRPLAADSAYCLAWWTRRHMPTQNTDFLLALLQVGGLLTILDLTGLKNQLTSVCDRKLDCQTGREDDKGDCFNLVADEKEKDVPGLQLQRYSRFIKHVDLSECRYQRTDKTLLTVDSCGLGGGNVIVLQCLEINPMAMRPPKESSLEETAAPEASLSNISFGAKLFIRFIRLLEPLLIRIRLPRQQLLRLTGLPPSLLKKSLVNPISCDLKGTSSSPMTDTDPVLGEFTIVRLAATTSEGLFQHCLRAGEFAEAFAIAKRSGFPIDNVYKTQWLRPFLPGQKVLSSSEEFLSHIDTSLARVCNDPAWVVHQCLTRLPKAEWISSEWHSIDVLHCVRHMLELGLERLNSAGLDSSVAKHRIQTRLLNLYLSHISLF
ncbi:unnamed protein product, partial [Protopolystoma xenopodis]